MKKLALLLLSAGLLFASCCYESLDDTAEYDIQVDNLFVSSMRSAISKNLGNNTSLSINIQFTGGYNDSKWKDVTLATLSGTIITFDSVPLGKTFDIWVGVYYGSELLYEASQKSIRLTSDTTELSLILKKLLNTQYVLYNYDSQNGYQYYLKDSPTAAASGESFTSSSNSFCFDNDGNFYYLNGNKIYSDRDGFPSTGVTLQLNADIITVDSATNIMYAGKAEAEAGRNNFDLYKLKTLISSKTSYETDDTVIHISSENWGKFKSSFPFVVYNGVFYTVGIKTSDETDNNPHLVKADFSGVDAGNFEINDLVNFGDYVVMPNGTVTDMLYQDGAVYILGRDVIASATWTAGGEIYSRGALFKYDISTGEVRSLGFSNESVENTAITDKGLYGYTKQYGQYYPLYSDRIADFTNNIYTYDESKLWIVKGSTVWNWQSEKELCNTRFPTLITPSPLQAISSTNFYGPSKFIGLKPKKLVISDDGIAFYVDNDAICYKNVNRCVIVDLATFAISSVVNTAVSFDSDFSELLCSNTLDAGSGFSSSSLYYKKTDASSTNEDLAVNSKSDTVYLGIKNSDN